MSVDSLKFFSEAFLGHNLNKQQIEIIMLLDTYKNGEILIDEISQEWRIVALVGQEETGNDEPTFAILCKIENDEDGKLVVETRHYRVQELASRYHRKTSRCNCSCGACR